MRRPVASGLGTAYVVVALLTRRITLSVAPWLTASIVVSLRGSEGIGGARGRISTPRIVPPLRSMPRVVDRSSGVWASIADIIVGASFRTVAGRSGVCTMARVYRGGAIASITPPVRISIAPSAIGGPLARIAMFVGRQSALAAAVAVEVRMRHRAATSGSCTPRAGAVRSHRQRTRNCVVAVVSCCSWCSFGSAHWATLIPNGRSRFAENRELTQPRGSACWCWLRPRWATEPRHCFLR